MSVKLVIVRSSTLTNWMKDNAPCSLSLGIFFSRVALITFNEWPKSVDVERGFDAYIRHSPTGRLIDTRYELYVSANKKKADK